MRRPPAAGSAPEGSVLLWPACWRSCPALWLAAHETADHRSPHPPGQLPGSLQVQAPTASWLVSGNIGTALPSRVHLDPASHLLSLAGCRRRRPEPAAGVRGRRRRRPRRQAAHGGRVWWVPLGARGMRGAPTCPPAAAARVGGHSSNPHGAACSRSDPFTPPACRCLVCPHTASPPLPTCLQARRAGSTGTLTASCRGPTAPRKSSSGVCVPQLCASSRAHLRVVLTRAHACPLCSIRSCCW